MHIHSHRSRVAEGLTFRPARPDLPLGLLCMTSTRQGAVAICKALSCSNLCALTDFALTQLESYFINHYSMQLADCMFVVLAVLDVQA